MVNQEVEGSYAQMSYISDLCTRGVDGVYFYAWDEEKQFDFSLNKMLAWLII